MKLPTLTEHQIWCCSNGCGECKPKQTLFEYSRTEFTDGEIHFKSETIFVSSCCDADLFLWDFKVDDEVSFELEE